MLFIEDSVQSSCLFWSQEWRIHNRIRRLITRALLFTTLLRRLWVVVRGARLIGVERGVSLSVLDG